MNQNLEVISVLKQLLKSRGLVYQDLARELELSLPTIKRMFSGGDLTISRLNDICRVLDIQMTDVFRLIETAGIDTPQLLSQEQESFLAKHPERLAYMELLANGLTPKQIEKSFNIDNKKTVRILSELDKLDLIEWGQQNKVKLKGRKMIKLRPDGPLKKLIRSQGVKAFLEDEFAGELKNQEFITFKATEETLKKLNIQMKQVIRKSLREGLLEEEAGLNTISIGAFLAVRPWQLVDVFGL